MAKKQTEEVDHVGRLRAVLSAMGIKRASFVDDKFSPRFEDAWARSRALASSKRAELVELWGTGEWEAESADDDRKDAEKTWEGRDPVARFDLMKRVFALDPDGGTDVGFFAAFWPSSECPLDQLGPERFDEKYIKDALLGGGPSILFLDLNFTAGDDKQGLRVLQEVLRLDTSKTTVCVVFTQKAGAENLDFWMQLAGEVGIDPSAAVVISKGAAESVDMFEVSLRRALLNSLSPELVKWASAIAQRALTSSLLGTRLEGDVINAAVLQSSEKEGVHPTETLFRLIDAEFRREREGMVIAAVAAGEFIGLKAKLEALATIAPTDDQDPPLSSRVRKLMRSHLYRSQVGPPDWPPPLWLGDLWEVCVVGEEGKESVEQFVLVAQPCDIILRSGDGARSQEWAVLVPLRREKGKHPETVVEFKYFDEPKFESRYAYLKRARVASANVLDLVAVVGPAIRKSEISKLRTRGHVHVALEKRMVHLADWLEAAVAKPEANGLAVFQGPGAPAKITNSPDVIDFHCRRTGRVEVEFSRLLLQRYGNFISRHALAHDFADYQK